MCGYFYIGFIDFMLKDKSLTDFTSLFSPNSFKENDDIILNYFITNLLKYLEAILLTAILLKNIPFRPI